MLNDILADDISIISGPKTDRFASLNQSINQSINQSSLALAFLVVFYFNFFINTEKYVCAAVFFSIVYVLY